MDILAMIQAIPGVGPYMPYVLMLFGVCAVVAAQLKPPAAGGSLYGVLYGVVNLLAHNYNQARNASAPASAPAVPTRGPNSVLTLMVLALGTGLLGACSTAAGGSAAPGSNAAADVAGLEAGLTAAEGLATAYVQLPACTGSNGPLCSTSTIVGQIKTADAQAYTLVKAAEAESASPNATAAAQAAVNVLTSIVSSLPKKGA